MGGLETSFERFFKGFLVLKIICVNKNLGIGNKYSRMNFIKYLKRLELYSEDNFAASE